MSLLWKTAVQGATMDILHAPGMAHEDQSTGRLLAYDGTGNAVGYLNYIHHAPSNTVGIDMIHVQPDHRRQGLGSALMDHLSRSFPDATFHTDDMSTDGSQWHDAYTSRGGPVITIHNPGSWW